MPRYFSLKSSLKSLFFIGAIAGLAGCSIFPTGGPSKGQLLAGTTKSGGTTLLVPVTQRIADLTDYSQALKFPAAFLKPGGINTDVVRTGDTLLLTVYENVEAGVLGSAGVPSVINHIQVDQAGFIFIPYAGRIKAAGRTTEALRRAIEESLAAQTPDPQVQLARAEGRGASVTVLGTGAQGVYSIDNATTHLSGILAKAGGTANLGTADGQAELTVVTVQRGSQKGSIWLQDLIDNPANDIHVRPGDRIVLSKDVRSYTTLGQVGATGVRSFPKPNLNALEAIAISRGINSYAGDATGIFVLRDEKPEVVSSITGVANYVQSKRVLYVLNIIQPDGLFLAQDFQIRDEDILYVTEAPYSQFTKVISTFLGIIGTGNRVSNTIEGL